MKEMFEVVTLEDARRQIAQHWSPALKPETISLGDAVGRKLALSVIASEDVPGFTRSTMDGFAVKADDTFGASEGLPVYLEITGEVAMGAAAGAELRAGQAVRISTGGMLPAGADAVVMLENTEPLDETGIAVTRPVAPGENLVMQGEDISSGTEVLLQGRVLRPAEMGVLAALGISEVTVEERLKVGIISTGNEVVDITRMPGSGQVRDINTYTLLGLANSCGVFPISYGIVGDNRELLRKVLHRALAENHLVLLSGGSSVGTRDLTLTVLQELEGAEVLFHGLALKPGKPTLVVSQGNKLIFGLPGHPVSALVVAKLLLQPLWVHGFYPEDEPTLKARLTRNLVSGPGREDYVRVRLRQEAGELLAEPVLGKSGLIATMAAAQGLVRVSLESEGLDAGKVAEVFPI